MIIIFDILLTIMRNILIQNNVVDIMIRISKTSISVKTIVIAEEEQEAVAASAAKQQQQ
jgi:hypothetical protein